MADTYDDSKARQVRALLLVFGSGIAMGIIVAIGMLYYYNPSGSYLAKNVLLTPENASTMRFNDSHSSRGNDRLVLNDIQFAYYDQAAKQTRRMHVDMDKYAQFYAMVSNETSLAYVDDKVKALFNTPHPSSMVLKVKPENAQKSTDAAIPFLTIEFANDGNHYRVQLREQGSEDAWAYFYYEGLYQKVLKLFTPAI